MKTSAEGFQQCYNAQVAVDGGHQLIVATELTSADLDALRADLCRALWIQGAGIIVILTALRFPPL